MNAIVFTVRNLMGIARFPKALQEAGFKVAVLCPHQSLISKTRYVDRPFFLRSTKQNIRFLGSVTQDLVRAMTASSATLVIPGDERAVYILHHIVRQARIGKATSIPRDVLAAIEFSLCDPAFFEATNNKNATQQLASELGIKVPKQQPVETEADALNFAAQIGYPVVLKKGIGEAGLGVKVCQNERELVEYLHMPLFAKPSRFKQFVRRLLGRDTVWIPNSAALAVQQFIRGTPAIYNVVAIAGRTLAGFAGIKEGVNPTGQTTRIRFVEHPEMAAAASSFVERTKYTGFADLEFIIDSESNTPLFLECNPRPTPLSPLGKIVGIDFCQALMAGLTGTPYVPTPPLDGDRVITLFPQEWLRDPQSPYLKGIDHDVPWDDPELVRAYLLS